MPFDSTDFGDSGYDYDGIKTRKCNVIPFVIESDSIKVYQAPHEVISEIGLDLSGDNAPDKALKQWFKDRIQTLCGKRISFLVENTTITDQESDKFGYWRFRLNPQHPSFDDYSYNGYSLILDCTRKKGRLKITRAFLHLVSRRPYETEGIIEGNTLIVCDSDDRDAGSFLSPDDFNWLLNLPERQKNLKQRLHEWEEYLEEYRKVVQNKVGWIAYRGLRRLSQTQAEVKISAEHFSDNAAKSFLRGGEVQIFPREVPDDKCWRPREDADEPLRFGSISKDSRLKGIFSETAGNSKGGKQRDEWIPITIDLIDSLVFVEPEEVDNSVKQKSIFRDPLERLPNSGLLVNSVFYDELPLNLQKRAISRLKDKNAANPRLEDFVFNIHEARVPIRDEDIDKDSLVETRLNPDQINAVKIALNAPDICLIQGPPGTGKTTVIAELCNQVTRRGGNVLISSQSNLAVDNALCRLANLKHIRPIRLGARTTEEGNDFLADNVVQRWFQGVKEKLGDTVGEQEKILQDLRGFGDAVLLMEQEYDHYCISGERCERLQDQIEKIQLDVATTTTALEETKKRLAEAERSLESMERIIAKGGLIEPSHLPFLFQQYSEMSGTLRQRIADLFPQQHRANIVTSETSQFLDLYSSLYQINENRQQSLDGFNRLLEIVLQQNVEYEQRETALLRKREVIQSEMRHVTTEEEMQALAQDLILVNREISELSNSGKRQLATEWREQVSGFDTILDMYSRCADRIYTVNDGEKYLISEIRSSLAPNIRYKDVIQGLLEFTQGCYDDLFGADEEVMRKLQGRTEELLSAKRSCQAQAQELQRQLAERNTLWQKLERDLTETFRQKDGRRDQILQLFRKIQQYRLEYGLSVSQTDENTESVLDNILNSAFEAFIRDRKTDLSNLKERFISVSTKAEKWHALQTDWIKKIEKSSRVDYEAIKDTYISFANVVGATCTETGKFRFWRGREFDLVIVDEVSKATPPELLMPMLLGKQIVLVGDHHQLPPIFRLRQDELPLSETDDGDATKKRLQKFEKLVTSSYFEEMFSEADDSIKSRLTEQYRMHPTIMNLINQFYPPDYQLTCGIVNPDAARQHPLVLIGENGDLTSQNAHAVWIDTSQRLVNERLVDNFEGREEGKYSSRYNQHEVDVIEKMLCSLNGQCDDSENNCRHIAVISFYAGQVRKLRAMVNTLRQTGKVNHLDLRVGTVDQFQGMERPIVIVSLVSAPEKRNGKRNPTEFVREFRRINVAFSRAQSMLVVVGAAEVFRDVPVKVNYGNIVVEKRPYQFLLEAAKDGVGGSSYVRGYDINGVYE